MKGKRRYDGGAKHFNGVEKQKKIDVAPYMGNNSHENESHTPLLPWITGLSKDKKKLPWQQIDKDSIRLVAIRCLNAIILIETIQHTHSN